MVHGSFMGRVGLTNAAHHSSPARQAPSPLPPASNALLTQTHTSTSNRQSIHYISHNEGMPDDTPTTVPTSSSSYATPPSFPTSTATPPTQTAPPLTLGESPLPPHIIRGWVLTREGREGGRQGRWKGERGSLLTLGLLVFRRQTTFREAGREGRKENRGCR